MQKYSFYNDYSEGVHPSILELMAKTNFDQEAGYGNDSLCREAEGLLMAAIANPQAAIHFVSGGTQANQLVLASLLRPYESVIAANTAHINVHEAGAIEATGHKINLIATDDGKLSADQVLEVVAEHTDEHMVKPRAVFISNSSEVGTVYRKAELESLAAACRAHDLYLYLDGARLGSALTSREADFTLADLGRLLDVFYVGGTKNGALIGEAIVINNPALQKDFRFHLKQRGALLAKGRLLGVQYVGLFRENLFFELARHANAMAERLIRGIRKLHFSFLTESTTNQIFPIFPDGLIAELQQLYGFYTWARTGPDFSAVRLVTSWATRAEKVDEFLQDLERLTQHIK
jgi:threonine aldolase